MSVQSEILYYIRQKKVIYDILLSYIEDDGENEEGYQRLIEQIEIQKIGEDVEEIKEFLRLLSCVSNNHVRYMYLIKKIEKILLYFSKTFKHALTSLEIFEIFGNNPRIYHFLHKNKIITVTEDIVRLMNTDKDLQILLPYFNKENNPIKSEEIEEKLEIGENDSYLCKIIREDSIGEFVEYIRQNSISPSSKIGTSDYETNIFLLQNPKTTLIEYAIFFGAIKIMNFLLQENAKLNIESFLYAIHSNNPVVISFLEDNIDGLYNTLFENGKLQIEELFSIQKKLDCCDILNESIKCHHNDLTNYLKNIFGVQKTLDINYNEISISDSAMKYRNYEFYTGKFTTDFNHACIFGYYNIAFLLLQTINSEKSKKFPFSPVRINPFQSCTMNNYKIIELLLSQSNKGITKSCFKGCNKLTQITIPPTIIKIDDYAFYECPLLIQVTIPSSVTSIGDCAFFGCSLLAHITIPSSVTSIGNRAFEGCSSLAQITVPSSVKKMGDHVFSGIKSIILNSNIQTIYDNMFKENSSLTQITIPSFVTSIGDYAFYGCSSLAQITIPSSVTSIGDYVFSGCSLLTQITIPSSIKKIGDYTFFKCSSLTQITIPSFVTSIGSSAFSECSSLIQITVPSSVTSIGNSAFSGCSLLTQITIPSSVTLIGKSAFNGCSKLAQITIPSSVTSIEDNIFEGCSLLIQITVTNSVTSIGNSAFKGCSSLTQITIPSSVTKIGNNVFEGCSSLTQITIPSSVASIGNYVFSGCLSLTQITIPSSVTSIGKNAFNGIRKLEIKGGIKSIPNSMFSRCSSVTQITIPSSVTSIGNNAFEGCSSLTQITIPSSVTSIGNNAFEGCSSLTQITIPSSVTSIGNYAFSDCSSLTQISIPSSVKNIGKCAFKGCPLLSQVSIPSFMPNESIIFGQSKRAKNNRKRLPKLSQKNKNDGSKIPRSNWGVNNANNQSNPKVSYEEKGYKSKANNNSINIISKANTTKSERKIECDPKLLNEYEIIHMLNHPNVIKTSGLFYDDQNYPFIEFEDSLTNLNEIVRNKIFSNAQLAYSIYQIAEGMKYIHSQKIMHLNLTPTNILISDDFTVKISGFQNAQKMTSENEIGQIEDIYSFGKIVYFILSGREINEEEQEQVINSFPSLAQQLMEVCLSNSLECKMTFGIICEVLDENNCNIISLTQQEIDELSTMIAQYKQQMASFEEKA